VADLICSERTEFAPAADSPCAACPWRTTNHGRRHPDGWYTKRNLRRLWAGLRRGERMTCHPTDPDNPVPEGAARPAPGHATRECTGSLVLVQREAQRINDTLVGGGGWRDYQQANPLGLTRGGAAVVITNVVRPMPGTLPMAKPDLNAPVSCPGLTPWEPR